jgi:sterol desaturase/sphingolipid hydroxylase (fatty acid hydroxylase superfamily)
MIWKEWIVTVLEITAVVSVIFAMVILAEMIRTIVKRWERKIPKSLRRNKKMSNKSEAREGVTFNDIFMFMIAVPLVLLWVGFAGFVIHTGLNNSAVLENIEAYTTLIAILGGPALLIIKDALDVWKQEQAEKTAFYKVKAQSVIDYNASVLQQAQSIETNEQVHEHKKK